MNDFDPNATLAELGVYLAQLTANGIATAVASKAQAIRDSKDAGKVRSTYEEIVNQLLQERAEAVQIAQAYKAELDRVKISDEDIEALNQTVGRVLDLLREWSFIDEPGADDESDAFEAMRELLNADTLRTMQLLGFNYKAAIGEPLTNLCASKVAELGKKNNMQSARRRRGK